MALALRTLVEKKAGDFSILWRKFERRALARAGDDAAAHLAPVFILGLPRSGTTLLYQLLLNYFDWSYFSNLMTYCYHAPVSMYRLQHALIPEVASFSYASEYGWARDQRYYMWPWFPSEGNAIWHRWFREEPTHYHGESLEPAARQELRATIAGISTLSGKPFLNKAPRHIMRLAPLVDAFPRALFLVLNRHHLYIAQSLYVARLNDRAKDPAANWWGIKPRDYERLKELEPLPQAVGQTQALLSELQTQLPLHSSRYLEIDYADVCAKPDQVLHTIEITCREYGIFLRRRSREAPEPFPLRNDRKVSEAEFDQLKALLDV